MGLLGFIVFYINVACSCCLKFTMNEQLPTNLKLATNFWRSSGISILIDSFEIRYCAFDVEDDLTKGPRV